jgi:hypothetical protein
MTKTKAKVGDYVKLKHDRKLWFFKSKSIKKGAILRINKYLLLNGFVRGFYVARLLDARYKPTITLELYSFEFDVISIKQIPKNKRKREVINSL